MKQLFYGGTILTMESYQTNAILVEDGIIIALGQDALKKKDGNTKEIDLKEGTLLPGFMDAHSHFTAFASTLDLVSLKDCHTFDELVETIEAFKKEHHLTDEEPIQGFGYDQNFLREKKHPDRYLLDPISNPILIAHVSGHMGVANTKMLDLLGLSSATNDPEGGKLGRDQNGLTGYLEETAFHQFTKQAIPVEKQLAALKKAEQIYFQYGITTAQEGLMRDAEFEVLQRASQEKALAIDIVGYVDLKNCAYLVKDHPELVRKYQNHFKIGGYKLILDGSPQGRTAWMLKPYEGEAEYKGYPVYQDAELKTMIRESLKERLQLLVHANGDAASEQLVTCMEEVQKQYHFNDLLRPVMIHAQFVREDQLKRMNKLGMIASFFVDHTFYWGDIHLDNFGKKRASRISPVQTAIKKDVVYTFHQDTPVLLPDMLETIWCSVNRITKNGLVLGSEEQISVEEALKGITRNAAYQYFEENKKGSIKVGKVADFVVLSDNPLAIDPNKLKEIEVLATYKNGELVYEK